jgi:mono/diheme cytochrome c family protein
VSPAATEDPPRPESLFDAGADAAEEEEQPLVACKPLESREPIPVLAPQSSADASTTVDRTVFTRDVFNLFKGACGACHVETNRGGFQVRDVVAFPAGTEERQQLILDRIRSDDARSYMPPTGQSNARPWSERKTGDSIVELASMLDAWFNAGSPPDLFHVQVDAPKAESEGYSLSPDLAKRLSNIGTCLPDIKMVGLDPTGMDDRDAFFEQARALPQRLDQTDLVSFDSETLAEAGVIAYAPTYPLFSDDARKIRHLRLPRGKKLLFNKQRQEFTLPENTRVYKTFFKRVIGVDGTERYRKIETRLIVARTDGADAVDGSHTTNALFGAYAWNEDESEALLVTDPLRNGQPFRDRLLTYITDEGKAQAILARDPFNKVVALSEGGATRNYAIPGSERCIQCHMGSRSHSFVLGLTPLQLNRRSVGKGGTYEDASKDEANQLQRLLDYGLISGLNGPEEITLLENAGGPERPPRNDYELKAQGYMLGNCAHCHNPRGYPSVQNPELREILNFFPSKDGGGIFQFPLDRTSPRIKRGAAQNVAIPYITPSLFDQEPQKVGGPKRLADADGKLGYYLGAPWRSLIYRNVDTPFTYSEDYALYPRMPMNAVGFDCRAPRIFGDWMVSIPAKLDNPAGCTPNCPFCPNPCIDEAHDPSSTFPKPQLYVEVKPGEAGYDEAVQNAQARLKIYHEGGDASSPDPLGEGWKRTFILPYRYLDYCADSGDTIDPEVAGDILTPQDVSSLPSLRKKLQGSDNVRAQFSAFSDGVPDHVHWVVTDTTETPGDWYPRRTDWASVLVDKELDPGDPLQQDVVEMLDKLHVSESFKTYATTPVPFGLWEKKDNCKLDTQPKVAALSTANPIWWLEDKIPKPLATDPVYFQAPGGVVFNEICVNCHGAKFDSRGRQADTLIVLTGGDARVANFRDGLLGPVTAPGGNYQRVFGDSKYVTPEVSALDWTARYVAWMGLGGTQRKIPQPILNVVGAVTVLGESRPFVPPPTSANMLSIARSLCAQSLGRTEASLVEFDVDRGHIKYGLRNTALIAANGDAQVWQELCARESNPPVRTLQYSGGSSFKIALSNNLDQLSSWYRAATYPANAPIGDAKGQVSSQPTVGVAPENLGPWCVLPVQSSDALKQLQAFNQTRGKPLPMCPTDWLTEDNRVGELEFSRWTLRAAANAGVAVFLYLDQLAHRALQGVSPVPAYDKCELLP